MEGRRKIQAGQTLLHSGTRRQCTRKRCIVTVVVEQWRKRECYHTPSAAALAQQMIRDRESCGGGGLLLGLREQRMNESEYYVRIHAYIRTRTDG